MKVIHATNYFLPEVVGGIETYIYHLTRLHRGAHIESMVALPDYGEQKQAYIHDGQVVTHFPAPQPSSRASRRRIYADFRGWLEQQRADIYHQHSCVPPISDLQLAAARSLKLKTVVTIHEPSAFCLRNTVMAFGTTECDGEVNDWACTQCVLSENPLLAQFAATMPLPISSFINSMPKIGRVRALGTKARVAERRTGLSGLFDSADRIVAISQWLHRTLQRNGCDPGKISYVPNAALRAAVNETPGPNYDGLLTVGFVGRASPLKGLDMLISAITAIDRSINLRVIIHAATGPHSGDFDRVLAQAAADPRIQVRGALTHDDALKFMASVDVLAVPSQWKECAPLVVIEALSVGTPVLGSRLGAIKEQVRDGLDGILLPHDKPAVWAKTIERLAVDRSVLRRLRETLRRPERSMNDVAAEMEGIYSELLSGCVLPSNLC